MYHTIFYQAINQKNASENENVPFRSRSATSPNFIKSRIPVEVKKVTNKGEETKKESSQDKLSAAFTFYRNNDLAYSTHLIPENVEDIDAEDHGNALLLPEYVNDIYSYLLKLEVYNQYLDYLKYYFTIQILFLG